MTKLFEAKPFIIAEIGSNWTNFQEAKDSIAFAKKCGADAVKFQAFNYQSLYGVPIQVDPASIPGQMPLDWLPKLKEKADACDIEFMCSAFSPELYDVVNPFVSVHKIASSELTYPQLLEKVKSFKKPILLSVGGSAKGDIAQAMQILRGGPQVVLMYCSSAYPSTMYNLFQMSDLKETFNAPVGFSDHSIDVVYPALSSFKHFDAVAIEKHVNFTESSAETPDSGHSLNAYDFRFMCEILHGIRPFEEFNPQPEEKDMFLKHNRRLIAIKDIKIGEQFKFGQNYGAFRSLKEDPHGLIPFVWEEIEKKNLCAGMDIKAGEAIRCFE